MFSSTRISSDGRSGEGWDDNAANAANTQQLSGGIPTQFSERHIREDAPEPSSVNSGAIARTVASTFQLPNVQPQQHASVFYLALIAGRCRTQAASTINARRRTENKLSERHPEVSNLAERLFAETLKELKKAGMLPPDITIPSLPELQGLLDSFDTILHNAALKQPAAILDQGVYGAIGNSTSESSLFERSQSQALIPQRFTMLPRSHDTYPANSSVRSLMVASGLDAFTLAQESIYNKKFKETGLLGKGGFGQVYRARHLLDDQEYAIKKIRINSDQLRSINEVQAEALVSEIRALAKLQHRNVVRYFDSWHEKRPSSSRRLGLGQRLLGAEVYDSEASSDDDSDASSALGDHNQSGLESEMRSLQIGQDLRELKHQLKIVDRRALRDSQTSTSHDEQVVFGYSNNASRTLSISKKGDKSTSRSMLNTSMFRKPSEASDEDDEGDTLDTEEIDRSEGDLRQLGSDEDVVLFIQMALHPMTLEDFIWAEKQNCEKNQAIQHCFHASTSAPLLMAILDGVEYIHSQHIVHRDLKPSNIFLSVSRGKVQPEGSINVTECTECGALSNEEHLFITPHIGDFGLIAKLDGSPTLGQPSNTQFRPSPLALLSSVASSRQPGTKFYCPPVIQKKASQIICPKHDVYSLGVIAYEMVVRFGTKSERSYVLGEISSGVVKGLDNHAMGPGIKEMLHVEREKRWDCAIVRKWLWDILATV
ncbi:hypothetical protein G7Y89_g351 [Cudoniella acicularis]|uniref:non-specific serine/threonine protein kinase n=1 Tax=Cudoniella acicularis TaxID=354080 RepID=A0A8H4W8E3_9HELO|nr:hypothetical protein G7Y89_g351 [Cudoniella acicularis]